MRSKLFQLKKKILLVQIIHLNKIIHQIQLIYYQIEVFKNYDLLVISPGGSCQTILMEMIKESNNNISMNLVSDADNLKHLSSYKNSIFNASSFSKILYIHRYPLKVLNSHFTPLHI